MGAACDGGIVAAWAEVVGYKDVRECTLASDKLVRRCCNCNAVLPVVDLCPSSYDTRLSLFLVLSVSYVDKEEQDVTEEMAYDSKDE